MSPRARRRSAMMAARDMVSKRETRAQDTPSTIVAARCQSAREGRPVRSYRNAVLWSSSFENDLTGAMVCQSSFRRKMPLVLPYRAMFFNVISYSVDYIASDRAESIENIIGMPWTRRFRVRTPHAQLCSAWKRDEARTVERRSASAFENACRSSTPLGEVKWSASFQPRCGTLRGRRTEKKPFPRTKKTGRLSFA